MLGRGEPPRRGVVVSAHPEVYAHGLAAFEFGGQPRGAIGVLIAKRGNVLGLAVVCGASVTRAANALEDCPLTARVDNRHGLSAAQPREGGPEGVHGGGHAGGGGLGGGGLHFLFPFRLDFRVPLSYCQCYTIARKKIVSTAF